MKEQPTTPHDYELAEKRKAGIKQGVSFTSLFSIDSPGMPLIINFSDQLEYFRTHPHTTTVSEKLWIHAGDLYEEVKLMPKEKTAEFAMNHVNRFGVADTEERLISTVTGTLFWNVVYHFKTLAELVDQNADKLEKKASLAAFENHKTKQVKLSSDKEDEQIQVNNESSPKNNKKKAAII